MKKPDLKTALSICLLLGVGAGCTFPQQVAVLGVGAYDKINEDSKLLERSYAAADYLVGQTRASVNKQTLIVPEPLVHATTGDLTPFGQIIMSQISARFTQLGYNVRAMDYDARAYSPYVTDNSVILTGTYLPDGYVLTNGDVKIALKMIDKSSNRILGAFDYFIPMTYEMTELMKPPPPPEPEPVPAPVVIQQEEGAPQLLIKKEVVQQTKIEKEVLP